jgi:hypothetical protein
LLAFLVLSLVVAGSLLLIRTSFSPAGMAGQQERGGSDLRLYRTIVERVRSGESYYDVAGRQLREQGYYTGSLFNWRPPVYAWLLASLPTLGGRLLFIALALAAQLMAFTLVEAEAGRWQAGIAVLLMLGGFLWCVDGDAFLAQELWSGLFILLSVCSFGLGRSCLGVIFGLLALFFRELALPYCLIALAMGFWQRRRGDVLLWLAGLGLYGLFFSLHALEVARHLTPADRVPGSWMQFGGAGFILQTCRMNVFLLHQPVWVAAIYLPLSLLGLAGWRNEVGLRALLTAGAYVAAFAIVGQPFNDYWGLMYAPLLPLGLVRAPAAVSDLVDSIRYRQAKPAE